MAAPDRPAALVLSPETPYPLHGGGALRTASILHFLAHSHDVDLIVFRHLPGQHPVEALPTGLVRRVHLIELPRHRRDKVSRAARNAWRLARGVPPLLDRFRGFEGRIAPFLKGRHYRVAIAEHFWTAPYQPLLAEHSERTVLNLHNIESTLHETCARPEGGIARPAHLYFARRYRSLEQRWFPAFDEILTASQPDAERVRCLSPRSSPIVFPNAIPETPPRSEREEPALAFSGNLEYGPNQQAVVFFAREVWPSLARQHSALRWRLIGMNPHAVAGTVHGLPRVEMTGPVADAITELARAQVVVAPLLSGSGTRLKIIEAWAAGRAVVATTLGVEGLPARHGENVLIADTAAEILASLDLLLRSPERRAALGNAGRRIFERSLNWQAAWRALEPSCLACAPV